MHILRQGHSLNPYAYWLANLADPQDPRICLSVPLPDSLVPFLKRLTKDGQVVGLTGASSLIK